MTKVFVTKRLTALTAAFALWLTRRRPKEQMARTKEQRAEDELETRREMSIW